MREPGDWWPCFSADTSEADVLEEAAAKLNIPEKHIETLRTGGGVLARVRQEDTE